MRWIAQLVALLLVFSPSEPNAQAAASVAGSSGSRSSEAKYVRLGSWAQANRFTVRWIVSGKTLQLSNHTARLVFTVDPQRDRRVVQINGVRVLLAFSLLYQNGAVYISQTDLAQTLAPILTPPRNTTGMKIDTVCLDPGHGGSDPGYRTGSRAEKSYTLLLAQEVRAQLKQAGFKVVMTRDSDEAVDRDSRSASAARHKADLFISLHFNAFPANTTVSGIEVYSLTPSGAYSSNSGNEGNTRWVPGNRNSEKNLLLAYHLQKQLVQSLSAEDRGVKRARFEVLRDAAMPAALVEGGFMSNPAEGARIFSAAYRQKMAKAIVDAVKAYKHDVRG